MKLDMVLFSEIGLNWSKVAKRHSWHARIKGQFNSWRQTMAHNKQEKMGPIRQWGGTGCLLVGSAAGRHKTSEDDPRKLGRWSSMTLRGRNDKTVRIVSVYIPTKSGKGPRTVANQQAAWLESQGIETPPITVLLEDLANEIQKWHGQGETIILGGDINMKVTNSQMATMLHRQGLREAVLSKHPQKAPVPTHIRAETDRVIDGIWVSDSVVVQRAGYSKFGSWDHRTAWIEISGESIFGALSRPTKKFEGRQLQTNKPTTLLKYQKAVESGYDKARLPQRAATVLATVRHKPDPTDALIEEIESIDRERAEIMLQAEKGSRRVFAGRVPYSPTIKTAAMKKKFWEIAWKRRQGARVSARWYDRVKKQAGIRQPTAHLTQAELQQRRKVAHEQWRRVKRDALEHRRTFLEQRADEMAEVGNTSASTALAVLIAREETAETFRSIKRAIQGDSSGSKVTMVIATDSTGEERTYSKEQDVISQCMQANEQKYRQAYVTPLQTDSFKRSLEHGGIDHAARRHRRSMDQHAQALLEQLQSASLAPLWEEHRLEVPVKEHQQAWARARERTASGPSGLHFGTWKANAKVHEVATTDAAMREISLRTGYNLKRWLRCSDITLLKEEGNFRVNRFRTISLVEGDFNANLKKIGREMMSHAEANSLLPEEQYGSRKQRSAAEVSLNNRLTGDIIRSTGRTSFVCSNDAKSCYDRMAHVPLQLSMRGVGVPPTVGTSVIAAVEAMKHHVLTGYGLSRDTYPKKGSKLQGLLQGLGISPAGWVAMSSPLMKTMADKGYGFSTKHPVTNEDTKLVCFSFVDDTDIIHTIQADAANAEACMAEIQQVVDTWEGMLRATGGALEPRKSYWYLLAFKWSGKEWIHRGDEEVPGSINIRQPDSAERSTLLRLPVDQARKALGVMVRHDGVQHDNAEMYTQKARKWADAIRRGGLLRGQAKVALHATIMKTLEYPLASATFTKAESESIMRPMLQSALPATGVQRNVSRALVFGPRRQFGLGVPHIYYTQVTRHVEEITKHWNQSTITGKLMRNAMGTLELQAGMDQVLTKTLSQWQGVLPDSWMKAVWAELNHVEITLRFETSPLKPPREGDTFIMERILSLNLTKAELQAVNLCRMAKQVLWVSDIANVQGDEVLAASVSPGPTPLRNSSMRWPRVGEPSPRQWKEWSQAVGRCFPSTRGPSRTLSPPLGEWRNYGSQTPQFMYDPEADRITSIDQAGVYYRRVPRRGRRREYARTVGTTAQGTQPVDGYTSGPNLAVTGSSPGIASQPPPPVQDLAAKFQHLSDSSAWAIEAWDIEGDETVLGDAIKAGTLTACSDGSVADGLGAAGAVITGEAHDQMAKLWLTCRTPRSSDTMQSHRAELSGLYSLMVAIQCICDSQGVASGRAVVGCDNVGALKALDPTWHLTPRSSDADLMRATRNKMLQLPISIEGRHVKGHQDDDKQWHELDEWAKMNVEADKLAGAQRRVRGGATPYDDIIEGEEVCLSRRMKITSVRYEHIAEEGLTKATFEILRNRQVVDRADEVSWPALGRAITGLDHANAMLTFKLVTGEAAVGKRMKQWGLRASSKCPSCNAEEVQAHIWSCPAEHRAEATAKHLKGIRMWMAKYPTSPQVTAAITAMLRSQLAGTVHLQAMTASKALTEAIEQQRRIGNVSLSRGLIGTKWVELQAVFLASQESRRSPLKWGAELARRIWRIAWEQWRLRNHDMFNEAESAEQEMVEAMRDRSEDLASMLQADNAVHKRVLAVRPGCESDAASVALWMEQAARLLRTNLATGPLLKWMQVHSKTGFQLHRRTEPNK